MQSSSRCCFLLIAPNGWRYPLVAGRENAILTGPASSHANCLKTRRLGEGAFECDRRPPQRIGAGDPTTMAPAYFAADRVDAVLGGNVSLNLSLKSYSKFFLGILVYHLENSAGSV